jgi:very-short-patch-repair endonuclease
MLRVSIARPGSLHTGVQVDRRKPLLLNQWEIATDDALAEAAQRCGVRVCAKVRLSSALDLDRSGLPDELFKYGTRAELDFVIADGTDAKAQFAVEYDGPQHLTDRETMRRDRMKETICSRLGLPLVRIGSEYLQRERRFTLIGYLVEVWNLEREFSAAQDQGLIPEDEPFIPEMVVAEIADPVEATKVEWPYWLDRPARLLMVEAASAGRLVSRTPEELVTPWPAPGIPDDVELVNAWAVLAVHPSGYIFGHAVLRNHPVFVPGVSPRSLAASVAVADAGRQLKLVLSGDMPAQASASDLVALRAQTEGWISQGGLVR